MKSKGGSINKNYFLNIGPHDGIGGTVKRKIYREVKTGKVVIEDAKQFADLANQLCGIKGILSLMEIYSSWFMSTQN